MTVPMRLREKRAELKCTNVDGVYVMGLHGYLCLEGLKFHYQNVQPPFWLVVSSEPPTDLDDWCRVDDRPRYIWEAWGHTMNRVALPGCIDWLNSLSFEPRSAWIEKLK